MSPATAILALIIGINTQPDLIKHSEEAHNSFENLSADISYKCYLDNNKYLEAVYNYRCYYKLNYASIYVNNKQLLIKRDIINYTDHIQEDKDIHQLVGSILDSRKAIDEYQSSSIKGENK